jgi:hypothetical protein
VKSQQERSPYRAGKNVTYTGVYRVFHSEHRVSHEVTLRAGEDFPPCRRCQNQVHFELLAQAPEIGNDSDFGIHLYQLECAAPAPAASAEQDDEQSA